MAKMTDGKPLEGSNYPILGTVYYDKFDGNGIQPYQLKQAKVAISSSGDNTAIAATTGKQIVVVGWDLFNKGTIIDMKFVDGTGGTDLTGPFTLAAAGAVRFVNRVSDGMPLTAGTVSTLLAMNLSGAQVVNGAVWYILV